MAYNMGLLPCILPNAQILQAAHFFHSRPLIVAPIPKYCCHCFEFIVEQQQQQQQHCARYPATVTAAAISTKREGKNAKIILTYARRTGIYVVIIGFEMCFICSYFPRASSACFTALVHAVCALGCGSASPDINLRS